VEPVAVNRLVVRNWETATFRTQTFWSSPTPFAYIGRPVYVLTSRHTFSGGEALAYDLRALELARIVGETTGGGANAGATVALGYDFAMFVPWARPENPTTGGSWEGVGVVPDVATAAEDALAVALAELGVIPAAQAPDALSVARLFEPRTAPQPESAVALRRVVDELARGELDYDLMSADWARLTHERQMLLQKTFEELGPVRAIAFEEVDPQGGDVYAVTFANASLPCSIALDGQGRTARFACSPPQ
jgi:hypothetical protein